MLNKSLLKIKGKKSSNQKKKDKKNHCNRHIIFLNNNKYLHSYIKSVGQKSEEQNFYNMVQKTDIHLLESLFFEVNQVFQKYILNFSLRPLFVQLIIFVCYFPLQH